MANPNRLYNWINNAELRNVFIYKIVCLGKVR